MGGLLGCSSAVGRSDEEALVVQPVAFVAGMAVDSSVVRMLQERHGIDEAAARRRAVTTLQLVAAARERSGGELPIDPARRKHLLSTARVRAYLDREFEPRNSVSKVSDEFVDRAMASTAVMQRNFHPRYHFVCQAVINPPDGVDALSDESWRERALAFMAPVAEVMLALDPRHVAGEDCEGFEIVIGLSKLSSDDEVIRLRMEQMVVDVNNESRWDPTFLERLRTVDAARVLPAFFTKHGLHLVVVPRILPERLADGSKPPAQLKAARRAYLREQLHPEWLNKSYAELIRRLRSEVEVVLAEGLKSR